MVSKTENLCLEITCYDHFFVFFLHRIFLNGLLEIIHVELNPIGTLLAASRDDLSMLIISLNPHAALKYRSAHFHTGRHDLLLYSTSSTIDPRLKFG